MSNDIMLKILENQSGMAKDIGELKADVKYHIHRTDLLEESMNLDRQTLKKDLAPIKKHVQLVDATLRILGAIGFIIGLAAAIVQLLDYFSIHLF